MPNYNGIQCIDSDGQLLHCVISCINFCVEIILQSVIFLDHLETNQTIECE